MKQINYFLYFLQKNIIPPKLYHWKTPLLISIILWCFAAGISQSLYYHFLINLSWLALTIGLGWATTQKPFVIGQFALGYWIVGALICLFLYSHSLFPEISTLLVIWPIISACVAVLFELGKSKGELKQSWVEIRPQFLIVLLSHFLISCWLGFHVLIQELLHQYPSILSEDFQQSLIVVNFQPLSMNRSRGVILINIMEKNLIEKTRNKPWTEVETLFYRNQIGQMLRAEVWKEMPALEENPLWKLETPLTQGVSRYNLDLKATWMGPTFNSKEYPFKTSCQVTRAGTLTEVQCDPLNFP